MPTRSQKEGTSSNKKLTVAELRTKFAEYEEKLAKFEAVKVAMQLVDLTKTETATYQVFSKDRLRTFMRNPYRNVTNLRNLSRFLYTVSHPYRRLIQHNAQMIDLTAQTLYHRLKTYPVTEDPDAILKNYYDTAVQIDKMALHDEIYKCLIIAWREDAFYGYTYEDKTGFFIMPLDGDYCQPSSINYDGTLNFAFDFSYFQKHQDLLEFWDKEFKQKYNKYQNDSTLRWQELDPKRTMCLKVDMDNWQYPTPPYIGLFEPIIDNVDLQGIQNLKDKLSVYKLLVARLQPLSGAKDPDDFEIDPDTAIEYYNRFASSLPPEVNAAISPMPIDVIDFKGNNTDDVDMIAKSTSNLFKLSGGSLILDNTRTGTTIYEAQILSEQLHALKPLLGQIEKWINRYLGYRMKNPAKVKYIEVTPYTKKKRKEEYLKSGQYGIPVKMAIAALDGISPLETLSAMCLENDVLELHKYWIPLQSSFTGSWRSVDGEGEVGAPTKDGDDLSDEGSDTREQDKNGKG